MELKNIRTFDEFREGDQMNEELLWGAIKQLFGKLFSGVDKKLADSVNNFTKKLDASKTYEESIRLFEQSTRDRITLMNESIKGVTGPLGVRKLMYDNSSMVFLTLQELANKYQSQDLAAKKIFEGQPESQMFNFDKSEDFKKNALNVLNAKVMEMNKTSKAYNDKDLDTYLKANNNIESVDQVTGGQPVENTQYGKSDKVFESEQQQTGNQQPNQQQNTTTPAAPRSIPQGNIENLKTESSKFLTNNIYGYSLNKVKSVKATATKATVDPVDTISKTAKGTKNFDTMSKLLRYILNMEDTNKLGNLRDQIAKLDGKDINQFKTDIGKF
jgi:hypothetical protein